MRKGELKALLGDIDGAIGDFYEALSAKGNYMNFGFFQYMLGNYDLAIQGLETSVAQDPSNLYTRFFLFMALSHLREQEVAVKNLSLTLEKQKKAIRGEWAIQISEFLLGNIDENAFIKAANNDNKKIQLKQLCEAFFYTAQIHLLNGDESQAKEYLKKCIGTGESQFYEFKGAVIQLNLRFRDDVVQTP